MQKSAERAVKFRQIFELWYLEKEIYREEFACFLLCIQCQEKYGANCLKTVFFMMVRPLFILCMCVFTVCACAEGSAEPAECGHLISERESAGGAAAVQAAVGRPGDGGDQATQSDQTTAAGTR